MKHLRSAIQFLTLLPVGKVTDFQPRAMMACFPLVGLILGFIIAVSDILFCKLWPVSVAAVLDGVLLIFLTGALHLDGLGDSADGLYGQWPREKALTIMKDSRIGSMALVVVVSTLAVKWAGLGTISHHRFLLLLIIPAYARMTILFGTWLLPYGRPDGGTAQGFFAESLTLREFRYVPILLVCSLFLGWQGILLNVTFVIILVITISYYHKKMGCITGDMLGAMVELTEAILFLCVSMGGKL
ncbi:MAG: adenosylcobinamide-GDP ribazoletransferase [Desulfobacteraceae bacterium]|jgi:adenosylcobinamide-GDP ribazoletransferase